jgi:hypothetical protein
LRFTQQVLDDVRAQIAPEDAALNEARERRDTTRTAAEADEDRRRRQWIARRLAADLSPAAQLFGRDAASGRQ